MQNVHKAHSVDLTLLDFFEIVEQLCRRLAAFTCVLPKNVNNIFFAPVSKEFAQEKSAF